MEYHLPGVTQVPVHAKAGVSFAAALRSILRQDPDVLMVGEMRDQETAAIGIEASLTGHLVLSTLHTNSAPETVTRLMDMGIEPFNVASALVGATGLMRSCSRAASVHVAVTTSEMVGIISGRNSIG